jgi:serine O-acetyltransferase
MSYINTSHALGSQSGEPVKLTSYQAFRQMLRDLGADIDRYTYMTKGSAIAAFFLHAGLWVMTQYRFSRWVHFHCHIPLVRPLLKFLCMLWQRLIIILTTVELPNRAVVGPGLFIPHPSGIVVHMDAKIGRHCNLGHQVTIGVGGRGRSGVPVIGDRVFIAPGAKLFGPIMVGNDVAIGANAVVLKDVPDHVVAAGIPAKIISHQGSQDFVLFRGCAADQVDHNSASSPTNESFE